MGTNEDPALDSTALRGKHYGPITIPSRDLDAGLITILPKADHNVVGCEPIRPTRANVAMISLPIPSIAAI